MSLQAGSPRPPPHVPYPPLPPFLNAYSAVPVSPLPGNPLFIIYSIAREKSWHVLRSRHLSDHVACIVFLLTCAVRTVILPSCRRKFPCSTAREERDPDSGWLCDSEASGSRRPGRPGPSIRHSRHSVALFQRRAALRQAGFPGTPAELDFPSTPLLCTLLCASEKPCGCHLTP